MKKKNLNPKLGKKLKASLKQLDIHQLEERLEVSPLVPGAGSQSLDQGFLSLNDCSSEKCQWDNLDPLKPDISEDGID